jgi:tetratricopeptide (TPR) repeat protein
MPPPSESEAFDHIGAGRFAEAETVVRALIGRVDDQDHRKLCNLLGLLGSILNSLGRHDDATGVLREALNHALHVSGSDSAANAHRYFLANQYLIFGDPEQALTVIPVVPPGVGHVQCLLHVIVAKALWALGRQDEARRAAAAALAAAPIGERDSVLSELVPIQESDH